MPDRALFEVFPAIRDRLAVVSLGDFPTPVEPLPGLEEIVGAEPGAVHVKRDDLTSPLYGGNKVRPLEVLFAEAGRTGATHVFATGAFGSNHAVATVVHAPRAGLLPGVVLYPQPASAAALANLNAIAARATPFVALPHWSSLPAGIRFAAWGERRRGHVPFFMMPGGATPLGALGYVNGALELALQVASGVLPPPRRVVVAGGSGCTTAGLLVGFTLAARLGIGFSGASRAPELLSVRVTPWPVTSRVRLLGLASRTSKLVALLTRDRSLRLDAGELSRGLRIDGRFLGRGYGFPTSEGEEAIRMFERAGGPKLEPIYSAKAAAALLYALKRGEGGPVVYWLTCSARPAPESALPDSAPPRVRHWAEQTRRLLPGQL
jgi:D-cysteine desulfhydrase